MNDKCKIIKSNIRAFMIEEIKDKNDKNWEGLVLVDNYGYIMGWEEMKNLLNGLQKTVEKCEEEDINRLNEQNKERLEKELKLEMEEFSRLIKIDKAQIKKGYIYFILDHVGNCKIGKTQDLNKRVGEYTKLPHKPILHHYIYVSDMTECERLFHIKFDNKRLRGEWFRLDKKDLDYIENKKYLKDKEIKVLVIKSAKSQEVLS